MDYQLFTYKIPYNRLGNGIIRFTYRGSEIRYNPRTEEVLSGEISPSIILNVDKENQTLTLPR